VLNSLSDSAQRLITNTNDVGRSYMIGVRSRPRLGFGRQCPALRGQLPLPVVPSTRSMNGSASLDSRRGRPCGAGAFQLRVAAFVVDARSGDVAWCELHPLADSPCSRGPHANAIAVKAFKLP